MSHKLFRIFYSLAPPHSLSLSIYPLYIHTDIFSSHSLQLTRLFGLFIDKIIAILIIRHDPSMPTHNLLIVFRPRLFLNMKINGNQIDKSATFTSKIKRERGKKRNDRKGYISFSSHFFSFILFLFPVLNFFLHSFYFFIYPAFILSLI